MNVTVNRTRIEIFEGAQAQHAVLRYLVRRHLAQSWLKRGCIQDAYGHQIGLDAPLREGQIIKFKIR